MSEIKHITLPDGNTYDIKDLISHVELTWSEYQQLPSTKNSDNVNYYITDKNEIYRNGIRYAGGSGASNLNELQDVTIDTPISGQVLKWNGTEWENGNAGGGVLPHLVISTDSGLTVTVTKGTTTITATETSEGIYECDVDEFGTYTLSDTENTKDVVIDTVTIYQIAMTPPVPEGATVTPTDDIDTWIKCAGLENTNNYTTLAEVMADTELFDTLLRDSNACDYMARSTEWAIQEGLVPTMTSNTTPSGTCFASSETNPAYYAFDNNNSTYWSAPDAVDGVVGYEFPSAVCIRRAKFRALYGNRQFTVAYSDDGTNYTTCSETVTATNAETDYFADTTETTAHKYWRINVHHTQGASGFFVQTVQFYADADITSNADAMARVGKYDYCSEALLSNATWAEAIVESEYFEEVLNTTTPKMTSNTTPSGTCFASSSYNGYPAYGAFDRDPAGARWAIAADGTGYIGYDYGKKTPISFIKHIYSNTDVNKTYKVQGSDDGTNYTDILTINTGSYKGTWDLYELEETVNYRYYRLYGHFVQYLSNCDTLLMFMGRHSSEQYQPLVPVMTSNTTPEGECFGSGLWTGADAYNAFDGNSGTYIAAFTQSSSKGDIGYQFTSPKVVKKFTIQNTNRSDLTGQAVKTFKLQGSNDGTNWTDLTETLNNLGGQTVSAVSEYYINNDTAYSYYKIVAMESYSSGGDGYCNFAEIQFYAKTTATTKVHSCPNDTLYITDGVDTEVLCTTDSNGIGSIDWSDFDAGMYNIFSSVAKDPSNLTKDYHKSVKVTNTQYGHTTDAYIMPDTVKTLYWYGYESNNFEDMTSANGWSRQNWTHNLPIHNTNDISFSNSYTNGVSSKNKVFISKSNFIAKGNIYYTDAYGYGLVAIQKAEYQTDCVYNNIDSASIKKYTLDAGSITNGYPIVVKNYSQSLTLYAFWYE